MTEQTVINKTERASSLSFRHGSTGTDVKLYFEDAEDLENRLKEMAEKSKSYNDSIKHIKEMME
jgi:hypothetical protein